jgi:hypothetical protein
MHPASSGECLGSSGYEIGNTHDVWRTSPALMVDVGWASVIVTVPPVETNAPPCETDVVNVPTRPRPACRRLS